MLRIFDIILLLILSPFLILLLLILIILSLIFHSNNIFYFQKRLGKNKKIFSLIKFRTMIVGAESLGTGLYSYSDDNRVTFFGKILRKTSLDEIPQIINIIKGEMSFVGPRPAVVGELEDEKGLPNNTELRFLIRPGLTGWAQIHGRNDLSWKEKIKYDIEFVKAGKIKKFLMCIYIIFFTPIYLLNFSATYEKK
tara:strand:- start:1077 stop:1661 length:585 start_codon:yes stop_codon:yes gene_type:complete